MKWLFNLSLILIGSQLLMAQDCDQKKCVKKGSKFTYENFKNNKSTGKDVQEVTVVNSTTNGVEATLSTKTGNKETPTTYTILCKGNSISLDLKGMLNKDLSKGVGPGNLMEVKLVSSEHMEVPSNAAVGTVLKDAKLKMKVLFQGKEIGTVDVTIKNRKVEGKETIQTPAGSFESIKISSTVEIISVVMGQTQTETTKSTSWFSHSLGLLKTVQYDAAGKIDTSRVLIKVE